MWKKQMLDQSLIVNNWQVDALWDCLSIFPLNLKLDAQEVYNEQDKIATQLGEHETSDSTCYSPCTSTSYSSTYTSSNAPTSDQSTSTCLSPCNMPSSGKYKTITRKVRTLPYESKFVLRSLKEGSPLFHAETPETMAKEINSKKKRGRPAKTFDH